jgi:hypothetical protein
MRATGEERYAGQVAMAWLRRKRRKNDSECTGNWDGLERGKNIMNISARVEILDLKICVSFVDKVVENPVGVFET